MAHVVSIWILNKSQRIVSYFIHKLYALMIRRVVDASLQDAASVAMRGNFHAIISHGVVNELNGCVFEKAKIDQKRRTLTWLSSGASLFKHF